MQKIYNPKNDNVKCIYTYIESLAGMSRSVAIVAGYLMTVTSFCCNDALDAIRSARSISAPNPGFYKQLLDFEIYCLRKECERMKLEYREKYFDLKQNDENEVKIVSINKSLDQMEILFF